MLCVQFQAFGSIQWPVSKITSESHAGLGTNLIGEWLIYLYFCATTTISIWFCPVKVSKGPFFQLESFSNPRTVFRYSFKFTLYIFCASFVLVINQLSRCLLIRLDSSEVDFLESAVSDYLTVICGHASKLSFFGFLGEFSSRSIFLIGKFWFFKRWQRLTNHGNFWALFNTQKYILRVFGQVFYLKYMNSYHDTVDYLSSKLPLSLVSKF